MKRARFCSGAVWLCDHDRLQAPVEGVSKVRQTRCTVCFRYTFNSHIKSLRVQRVCTVDILMSIANRTGLQNSHLVPFNGDDKGSVCKGTIICSQNQKIVVCMVEARKRGNAAICQCQHLCEVNTFWGGLTHTDGGREAHRASMPLKRVSVVDTDQLHFIE